MSAACQVQGEAYEKDVLVMRTLSSQSSQARVFRSLFVFHCGYKLVYYVSRHLSLRLQRIVGSSVAADDSNLVGVGAEARSFVSEAI